MLRRKAKRLYSSLPPENSDNDDKPHCSTYTRSKSEAFARLEVQSNENALDELDEAANDLPSTIETECHDVDDRDDLNVTQIPKKRKVKTSRRNPELEGLVAWLAYLVIDYKRYKLSSLEAVQKKPAQVLPIVQETDDKIFCIRSKHLTDSDECVNLVGRRGQTIIGGPIRIIRNPITPTSACAFMYNGLTLSLHLVVNGTYHYLYNHSAEYQAKHRALITLSSQKYMKTVNMVEENHVEGLLKAFKVCCLGGNYVIANQCLERAIAYLQYVADQTTSFDLISHKTRLEYKFVENRPFHISILLYSHMLSSKACHRTALELVKLLLNLDPSDPLAVVLIMDVFAIRANEYSWLIEAIDYLDKKRDLKRLVNIKYSYALAHFHVSRKQQGDLKKADDLLKEALLLFPSGLTEILKNASLQNSAYNIQTIYAHKLFNSHNKRVTVIDHLIKLYSGFMRARFCEPPVLEWMLRNAMELINNFDSNPKLQDDFAHKSRLRNLLYVMWPVEISRHIIVIAPMSKLIVDGLVPVIPWHEDTDYFNPMSEESDTINRYAYATRCPSRFA